MGKWRDWLADRFGTGPIEKHFLHRRVPETPWYFGDGTALLVLFGVLVGTGMVMALSYVPSPAGAYASVKFLTEEMLLGRFVRGLHYWAAGFMVLMVFWHLFRQILVGGYKVPREGTWLVGVAMFILVITNAYTGYTLRWDERALAAIQVALSLFYLVPGIGEWLVLLVQGGPTLGASTLTRLYGVHVLFVPLALMGLVAYHVYLVVLRGVTGVRDQPVHSREHHERLYQAKERDPEESEDFYPEATAASGLMGFVVFAVVAVLAWVYGPGRLFGPGDPTMSAMVYEEWWFAWYSALVAYLPPWLAPWVELGLPLGFLAVLVILPFVDRGPYRGVRHRPVAIAVVSLLVLALVTLTALRFQSAWTGWPRSAPPTVPAGVTLPPTAEEGRRLFAAYGCHSCHAVAGEGPQVGTDIAAIEARYSPSELRDYILHPPAGVAMPAYADQLAAGRLTERELALIVEFVLVGQTFPTGR